MAGSRSQDKHFCFGFPSKLSQSQLPTKINLFCHSQFLRREKIASGEWLQNVSLNNVAKAVANDCAGIWNLTGIPHQYTFMEHYILQKIKVIIEEGNKLKKIPKNRRHATDETGDTLFDIAACQHPGDTVCDCPKDKKVPDEWKEFLNDQRNSRSIFLGEIDRVATEQNITDVELEEEKKVKKEKKDEKDEERRVKWKEEKAVQFKRVSTDVFDTCHSGSETDEEWEDFKEPKIKIKRFSLPRFAKECDRYKISNRAGAAIGNALLKDHGIVTKEDTTKLIDHSKLRRERMKAGKFSEKKHKEKKPGKAIYFDGKKCKTLVRKTTGVQVQKRGMRGRGSSSTFQTKRVKLETEEHYTVVEQPDARYLTHFTPESGSARDIATELVDVVCEEEITLDTLGCDGTNVNIGENNGAIRIVELDLSKPLQHFICLLHTNELPFR